MPSQGKYIATPAAPTSRGAEYTQRAFDVIREESARSNNQFIMRQKELQAQLEKNNKLVMDASKMAAEATGRKGYDKGVMDWRDSMLDELLTLQKKWQNQPFDNSLRSEYIKKENEILSNLKGLGVANKMFDAYVENLPKADPVLRMEAQNNINGVLERIDNGEFEFIDGFKMRDKKTGKEFTYSNFVSEYMPTVPPPIDMMGELHTAITNGGLDSPTHESTQIIVDKEVTIKTWGAENKGKITDIVEGQLYTKDGDLTPLGKKLWLTFADEAMRNGENPIQNNRRAFASKVADMVTADKRVEKPAEKETPKEKKPLTGTALKQYNFDETAGDIAKGSVEKLATMKKAGRSYGSTIIDGYEYADGIIIDDASFVPSQGDYTKIRLAYKNPKGEETEKPKIKTYDLNNDADRGEFFAILANMDEFRGAVPAKMPIEQKVGLTEMKREYPTTFADQVAEATIAKIGGTGEKLKNSAIGKIASDLTNELSDYGVTVDTRGAGYNGVTLRGNDNTITVKNIHTEQGKEELRKAIKEILGESDTKQPEAKVEIPNNVNKEMMVTFKGKPRKVSEIWGELNDSQKQAIIDNSK